MRIANRKYYLKKVGKLQRRKNLTVDERKEYYCLKAIARHKRTKQATPSWIDLKDLLVIYRDRPEGYHVDHIIPLNGRNVSGLHVPWNLQYLSKEDNLKKGNKIDALYEKWEEGLSEGSGLIHVEAGSNKETSGSEQSPQNDGEEGRT